MTSRQRDFLIRTHTALMNRAKRVLDERYYELEDRGVEMEWIAEYLKHKEIVAWAEAQKPDD